jgi:hypothetical protein
MNLDEYVQFVEKPSSELYSLKVLQGPYTGVIYTYGKVQFEEDESGAECRLKFMFQIEDVPANLNKKELEEDTEFKNFMGDILTQLIEERGNDESTNTNTKDDN